MDGMGTEEYSSYIQLYNTSLYQHIGKGVTFDWWLSGDGACINSFFSVSKGVIFWLMDVRCWCLYQHVSKDVTFDWWVSGDGACTNGYQGCQVFWLRSIRWHTCYQGWVHVSTCHQWVFFCYQLARVKGYQLTRYHVCDFVCVCVCKREDGVYMCVCDKMVCVYEDVCRHNAYMCERKKRVTVSMALCMSVCLCVCMCHIVSYRHNELCGCTCEAITS